ncbi:MAG TPA: pilus assembly protein N-terminal domain-containing protein [Planctomycetaceae bacterium]|nr:pilus assembly protein N-terminal domain-containing protein [Planctomycetaceae bacterium]
MSELLAVKPHFRPASLRGSRRTNAPGVCRLWVTACLLAGCAVALVASPVAAQNWQPVPPVPSHYGAEVPPPPVVSPAPAAPAIVADAAGHPRAGRALPEQISAMPGVSENLDVMQHHSQLVIARTNIVRTAVADPSIIDVVQFSPNELSIIGLDLGSTTLTLWFDNSHQPLIYQVNTLRDPSVEERRRLDYSKLERKLAILFPNSKVYLIPFSGKLVVKGQAHDTEEAAKILQIIRGEVAVPPPAPVEIPQKRQLNAPPSQSNRRYANKDEDSAVPTTDIVNLLEVPGEFQVMLRVRIAELNRTMLRSMGVNLNNVLFDRRHTVQQIRNTRRHSLAGIFENGEIDAAIHALMSNGTATILSEPVLTVVSGHSASFLSGGEFAVPTIVGVEGVGAQQTTFHGFGTSLVVTPSVLDHDLVRMKIVPEFSQLDSANTVNGIPGVDTRRAETTVQLREGQTIVLAGLISRQTNTQVAKVGFWGDAPVVGPLFSSKRSTQEETELLILVTPEIVRPMDTEEVPPLPGHEVTVPNNCEFFKLGKTQGCPDPTVYQAAPYGSGQTPGMPAGLQMSPSGGPATAPSGPAPMPPRGYAPPAPPAGAQYQPQPRGANVAVAPDPLGPTQAANFSVPCEGPIQQTSASFAAAAPNSVQQDPSSSTLKWYQRPFRSLSGPQSAPQRPADGSVTGSSAGSTANASDSSGGPLPQQVRP